MDKLNLSDMAQICAVQNAILPIINECIIMASRIKADIFYLSNGWFMVTRNDQEVYYDRFSELYSDLSTGMLNDYLMSVV